MVGAIIVSDTQQGFNKGLTAKGLSVTVGLDRISCLVSLGADSTGGDCSNMPPCRRRRFSRMSELNGKDDKRGSNSAGLED
jgi:hypothetical protein